MSTDSINRWQQPHYLRPKPHKAPPKFTFDEDVVEVGKQITLADLLMSSALEDLTIAHVLMLISNARSNLFKCKDKTGTDKILQVDLQDLYRAIGQESMDSAHNFITNKTTIKEHKDD